MGPHSGAVHAAIEPQFGELVAAVEQPIRAVASARASPRALGVKAASPDLWACRKYRNQRGELIELTISIDPAHRFSSQHPAPRMEWRGPVEQRMSAAGPPQGAKASSGGCAAHEVASPGSSACARRLGAT